MENCVKELYDVRELSRLKTKLALWRAAAAVIGIAGLALCIWSMLQTDRHFPVPGLIRTIGISVAAGWIIITLRLLVIKRIGYARAHIEAILKGKREEIEGVFTLTKHRTLLEKGVNMRRVDVSGAERIDHIQIYDKKAKLFDDANAVKVYSVHGFIAAYAVKE